MTTYAEPDLGILENELFWNIKVKHLLRVPYWCLWAAGSAMFLFCAIMLFTTIAASVATIPVLGFIVDILLSDIGSVIAIGVIAVVPGYCLYAFRDDIDSFNKNIIDWFTPTDPRKDDKPKEPRQIIDMHSAIDRRATATIGASAGLLIHSDVFRQAPASASELQEQATPQPQSRRRALSL